MPVEGSASQEDDWDEGARDRSPSAALRQSMGTQDLSELTEKNLKTHEAEARAAPSDANPTRPPFLFASPDLLSACIVYRSRTRHRPTP